MDTATYLIDAASQQNAVYVWLMKLLLFRDEFEVALKVHAQASQSEQAAAEAVSKTTSLTSEQLTRVFTASAIPFVGFGFLDNLIMVRAAGLGPTIPTGISQHVIQTRDSTEVLYIHHF